MKKYSLYITLFVIVVLNIASIFFHFRLDLTSEGRYTLSDNTKTLMKSLSKNDYQTEIIIYLDGDLNAGFIQLKKGIAELLDECQIYTKNKLTYRFVNPSEAKNDKERQENYIALMSRGLEPKMVYEKDDEGRMIEKVVFPWAEIIQKNDTIPMLLLQDNPHLNGTEDLNHSIEGLEFALTDAIRVQQMKQKQTIERVAFIEGHGELDSLYVISATESFARYFQVDRGNLKFLYSQPEALDLYKAIIIAGPRTPFSEQEKFIIDQYIMRGGRVMWLVDGVKLAEDSLSTTGMSPSIALDVNLSDQLFKYGVRIVPALLQDMQCIQIPVNVSGNSTEPQYEPMPFYYSPLLLTSPEHAITKNLTEVKASFTSGVDLSVNSNENIQKTILLATSNASKIIAIPERIDIRSMSEIDPQHHFNTGYLPVAAALEGKFSSVFTNRLIPDSIISTSKIIEQSVPTRMVVIANADIIRNSVIPTQQGLQIPPLGYDRYSNRIYGNKDFILNSLLYLTDDEGWLNLRAREFKLRLLNKKEIIEQKQRIQFINVLLPIISIILLGIIHFWRRKRKYGKVEKN